MTGRGVQWVLRTAKEQHNLTVDCGYDKAKREWNVWCNSNHHTLHVAVGATPADAYRNFLTVNNFNANTESN